MAIEITRKQLYWACQIAGWGLYTLTNLLVSIARIPQNQELQPKQLWFYLVLFLGGIGLTHGFRFVIRRFRWLQLMVGQQIIRIFLGSMVLSGFSYALLLFTSNMLGTDSADEYRLLEVFIGWFSQAAIMLIWSLIYVSVQYFANYKREEIERLKQEADLRSMELNTLRSQINPHFIFNALNSIRALISENPKQAQESITRLSKILRNSLYSNQQDCISLQEELTVVSDYLSLESVRYEERLQIKIEADAQVMEWQVPALSVLTLVENAIKHGIAHQMQGGLLRLTAYKQDNLLKIKVQNPGDISPKPTEKKGGYGLQNIHERLRILYKDRASLSLNTTAGNVEALLLIPKEPQL